MSLLLFKLGIGKGFLRMTQNSDLIFKKSMHLSFDLLTSLLRIFSRVRYPKIRNIYVYIAKQWK